MSIIYEELIEMRFIFEFDDNNKLKTITINGFKMLER